MSNKIIIMGPVGVLQDKLFSLLNL